MMPDYVLLVRHATRDRKWQQSEAEQSMEHWTDQWNNTKADFDKPGLPRTLALTGALRDELKTRKLTVVRILHSNHVVAKQTASVIGGVLEVKGRTEDQKIFVTCDYLSPETENDRTAILEMEGTKTNGVTGVNDVKLSGAGGNEHSAWIVIGHQPQLTRIARHLLDKSRRATWWQRPVLKLHNRFWRNSLPANTLPLGNSEIACVKLGNHPQLLWLLTEKSKDLLAELKTKIASKYDVAKFFLGALVVGTGLTLNEAFWKFPHPVDKAMAGLGAFSALLSLGLTAATLFSYDRLLMPKEFWGEGGAGSETLLGTQPLPPTPKPWSVTRPPGQIQVILFYEMVHIWTHLFIPAVCCAFAALGFLLVALAHNGISELSPVVWIPNMLRMPRLIMVLGLAALAFLGGGVAFRLWKPHLGFDD